MIASARWARAGLTWPVQCSTFLVALTIVYLSVPYVLQSYDMMEGSPDPGGLPYRYLLKLFLPLGFGLLMVQATANLLQAVIQIKEAKVAS